jgi:hypothetical protein
MDAAGRYGRLQAIRQVLEIQCVQRKRIGEVAPLIQLPVIAEFMDAFRIIDQTDL